MADARYLWTLPGAPRRSLSRVAGALARIRVPRRLRSPLWSLAARRLRIAPERVPGAWADYPRFLDLFTRPLPDGGLPPATDTWLSPAEGLVVDRSAVTSEGSWVIKGTPYSAAELLLDSLQCEAQGLQAVQIHLAPHNYHRFHAPCDLEVLAAATAPGDLLPVDPRVARRAHRILARNRRILVRAGPTGGGFLALLFVGALNVGRIRFTFDATLGAPPLVRGQRRYDPPPRLAAGEEMGRFELGSTIVLFAPAEFRLLVPPGQACQVRQPLLAPAAGTEV